MLKLISRLLFSGLATVLTVVAMTNMEATSLFMMYEPEPPKGN
ncbi:MAG: cyclic lactone autoinducer peptide [Desulfotomaculaceae bacterium]